MFVNNLVQEKQSSFSQFLTDVSINSYELLFDKIVINGTIKEADIRLGTQQLITRIVLVDNNF